MEWEGNNLPQENPESVVYYTHTWVDLDIEVVRRALASALQRSGSVEGLGDAFRSLETARITQGVAVHIGGDYEWSFSDLETVFEDASDVSDETAMTWVEIDIDN